MGRFINPFTDYGFKFLFGREVEKELLIDFLNDLLVGEHVITDIQFLNNEQLPEVKTERGIIYDIYCVTDTGERIIVEMQNREQPYFKDRALFYLSRAITQQAKKGIWDFQLDAVYGVFFMNFVMNKDIPAKIRTDVVLADRDTGKVFNGKFRQIFIELPNFNKEEDECSTDFERWIYILKHMDTLDRMPFKARKAVFERLEKMASKANMTQEERAQYEEEWKFYNDYFNTLDFAQKKGLEEGRKKGLEEGRKEGKEEGMLEARIETARKLKELGVATEAIASATGFSPDEIESL
ncbi:Rpn family recombination-promoting nuclease/putative transposase [Bacteroides sp. f07]|uniref:Rpn family recombination-promoting nuclease/putative transposase n=2 Tax=Bacteroides TaxID=816 RepID=UPI0034BE2306